MDGDFPTPQGVAKNDCEKREWLVVSPTRAEFVDKHGIRSETRDDGVAFYRVGNSDPVSIPQLGDEMGGGPTFERHSSVVRGHDTKRAVAAGLGVASVVAITVGTILFVKGFKTERGPGGEEQQKIESGMVIGGGLSVGLGLGLGIGGIALNPGQAERSRAQAARYVYLPPDDTKEAAVDLASRYNQAVRERCERPAP